MKGGAIFLVVSLWFGALNIHAQGIVTDVVEVPLPLSENQYLLESLRLTALARESYEEGDYDASRDFAKEALRYARLSDEYVGLRLKIREADQAIAAAESRLEWAAAADAPQNHPKEYALANVHYQIARTARGDEDWDEAIAAANRVLLTLAALDPDIDTDTAPAEGRGALPARYTVRPWNVSRDCLWNIAARPWAYGDSSQWRVLYNANKDKLPNPNNPNVIEPGTVLDIPSIHGEVRRGIWDPNRSY